MLNPTPGRPYLWIIFVILKSNSLPAVPRSRICGESSEPVGYLEDDLAQLNGDGDSCIYRIKTKSSDATKDEKDTRIKLRLYESTSHGNCIDEDHVFIIADGSSYGPFCHTRSNQNQLEEGNRHRRAHHEGFGIVLPDSTQAPTTKRTTTRRTTTRRTTTRRTTTRRTTTRPTTTRRTTTRRTTKATQAATQAPAQKPTQAVTAPLSTVVGEENVHVTIPNSNGGSEVEGSFKADEVDVVYVTAPGGYKFRFKFMFEWELIEMPSNGTYAINGTYAPNNFVPAFDQFGIPTDYTAMCNVGHFEEPSSYIFKTQIDQAEDAEYASKVTYTMLIQTRK